MRVVTREEAASVADYAEILEKENHHSHEIVKDEHGVLRWRQNDTVRKIIDKGILNDLWILFGHMGLTKNSEEVRQLYRDMGYSLSGYWEIFYWEVNNEDSHLYRASENNTEA